MCQLSLNSPSSSAIGVPAASTVVGGGEDGLETGAATAGLTSAISGLMGMSSDVVTVGALSVDWPLIQEMMRFPGSSVP